MKVILVAGLICLVLSTNAQAYLDPGSGSAILQGILGALAAIAITLKLYWHRFLRLIGLGKPRQTDDVRSQAHVTPEETDDSKF